MKKLLSELQTTNSVDTAEDEEHGAKTITIESDGDVMNDVPQNPSSYVTVEEGNSYELRIFWYAVGLESEKGVGLVLYWPGYPDGEPEEFTEGMLREQFILHNNTNGTDQNFH